MIQTLRNFWRLINAPIENPEQDQRPEQDSRALSRLLRRYYWSRHWPSLLLVVALGSAGGLTMFAYAAMSRVIADDIVEVHLLATDQPEALTHDPSHPGQRRRFSFAAPRQRAGWVEQLEDRPGRSTSEKLSLLARVGAVMLLVELLRHALLALVYERTVATGQQAVFRMRRHLHDKLHALPLSYHDRHSPGRLMTHLFSDVTVIQQHTTELLRSIPPNIMTIVVGVGLVLSMAPDLALAVLLALPAYWYCYHWFRPRLHHVSVNLRDREGRLNAHVANRVSNFQVVKAFGGQTHEALDFLRQTRVILRQSLGSELLGTLFGVACGLVTGASMAGVLWLGALRVRDGQMTLGTLLMFYSSAAYLFAPIATLTTESAKLQRLKVAAGKIMRVLDEPVTLSDGLSALPAPRRAAEIRLERVTMRYQPDRPAALEDVSFTLPTGQRLAVMGPSGCGKSTLAKLLCRLYDPSGGVILLDGIDLRQYKVADLRHYVGFVAQEPVVFSGTIAENIMYGSGSAAPRAVATAAQYAQIHTFIEQLPRRYRTLTQERGLTLSGGQKQRVGLARALLMDTPVLVLDDCTSALDAHTEARLMDGFATVLRGRTVVIVSHRVSVAMRCDLVLMLDAGRVAQFGPPQELLKQPGPFAQLYEEQHAPKEPALV